MVRISLKRLNIIKFKLFYIKGDSGLCDEEQELSKCKHCAKQGTGLHFTTTTTPKPSLCWQQGKNPCNLGTCTISSTAKHGYLCFCPPDVQGNCIKLILFIMSFINDLFFFDYPAVFDPNLIHSKKN